MAIAQQDVREEIANILANPGTGGRLTFDEVCQEVRKQTDAELSLAIYPLRNSAHKRGLKQLILDHSKEIIITIIRGLILAWLIWKLGLT